jgi:hypothetical protein
MIETTGVMRAIGLLQGRNLSKRLVRLAPDPTRAD